MRAGNFLEAGQWTKRTSLVLGLMAAGMVAVASAQAAVPMYVLGKLTVPSFGNDTTTGASAPLMSTNYLGIPFGQACNSAHGTGTTACYATSSYQSAHDGSPLLGTGVLSVATGASPNPLSLPASLVSVKLGTFPTVFSSPSFAKKPVNGVPGGSFSYYPPYIYSYTYADLKNAAGNFFAGGGPGNFTFNATAGGLPAGSLTTTAGANKFGGTMGMLGMLQTHFAYSRAGGLSIGTDNWLVDWMGKGIATVGGASVVTTATTGTNKHNVLMETNTNYVSVSAFPWTTGVASATATRGPFFTVFARSGYDTRTAGGAGNIQMVSPMLTHWRTPAGDVDYETASIGVFTLQFVPEPSSAMILMAGISLLGLAYRGSRKR
ncbi:MAG: PEP-CTERM sorting domain-containing protein [Myxococcota bacterium]|nr:PEP-CTERM sorting domain-containing protein [Myxococcota bacterium]